MSIAVKICGIRTPEHALVAAEAGADLIGLVFAPSKRQIDLRTALAIVTALRGSTVGQDVTVVGVFVDETPANIADIAGRTGLDWVQLSGHEAPEAFMEIGLPVIKALRFDGHPSERLWIEQAVACDVLPILVDAHVAGSYGGAGVLSDWGAAARLAMRRPVLLAGGLTADNVAEAVTMVQPWGVDVSSGVETSGVKDAGKIRAFVHAAKRRGLAGEKHDGKYGIKELTHEDIATIVGPGCAGGSRIRGSTVDQPVPRR